MVAKVLSRKSRFTPLAHMLAINFALWAGIITLAVKLISGEPS